jgi:hypothetical protein
MNKGAKTEREARRQREQTLPPILKTQKPKTPTTRKLKLSSQTQMHGPEKNPLTRLRTRDNNTLGLEEKRRKKNPANPPPHTHPQKNQKSKTSGKKNKNEKRQGERATKKKQQQHSSSKNINNNKKKGKGGKQSCAAMRNEKDANGLSSPKQRASR